MTRKIVLAYSGGLDTSVALKWLKEKYESEIVTVTLDVGQQDDFAEIEEKAQHTGALKHYTIEAKKEFVEDYVFPSIRANGLYEGEYPLGTALARPLIAEKLVEVAEKENAYAVAHGCTGKGNDQIRFDVTVLARNPRLKMIAPVREWNLTRDEEIDYAKKHEIVYSPKKSEYSIDQNLWGRSIEAGPLEDPFVEPRQEAFEWVKPPANTPDEPTYLSLEFRDGIPVAADGQKMGAVEIVEYVNGVAGNAGVGIIDHVEDRLVGIKSREVYEAPAAVTIIGAHRDLEKLVLTRNQLSFKAAVEQQWAWLVYSGLWVEPLRRDLEAFISSTQTRVEGKVKVKILKGGFRVVGRASPYSLYDAGLATYTVSSTFDQKAAVGFSDLWGLSSRVAYRVGAEKRD
jgi:argininosuccinate synthase